MTKETAAILRLIDALKRKDTDHDGNWGFPSFQEELEDIRIMLEESVMTTNPNTPEFETVDSVIRSFIDPYTASLPEGEKAIAKAKRSLKQSMRLMMEEVIGPDDRDYSQDNADEESLRMLVALSNSANDLRNEQRLRLDQALTKFFGEG